jgi:hypothetical protein
MRFGLFKRVQLGEILPIGISWRVDKSRRPAELGIFIVVPVDIRPVEEYADENGYFMYCRGRRLTLAALKICFQFTVWHKPVGKQEMIEP